MTRVAAVDIGTNSTRLLVADATKQGTEVAAGVRAGSFEARPERRRCRLCPYRLACVEAL